MVVGVVGATEDLVARVAELEAENARMREALAMIGDAVMAAGVGHVLERPRTGAAASHATPR